MTTTPLHRALNQLAEDRWARRGLRRLVRALWIAAAVACVAIIISYTTRKTVDLPLIGALALVCLVIGLVSLLGTRISPAQTARALDRRFALDEELATAIEVAAQQPDRTTLAGKLVVRATRSTIMVHQLIAEQARVPWGELAMAIGLGICAIGLALAVSLGAPNLDAAPVTLPPPGTADAPEPPPIEPELEPTPPPAAPASLPGDAPGSEPGAGAGSTDQPDDAPTPSNADPQTLGDLADALRNEGVTRGAADALDRGDTAAAARELREAAAQAGQIGEQTRERLADALREAAERTAGRDPAAAERMRDAANGLDQGGQQAADALEALAREVEGQGSGAGQGQQPGSDPAAGAPGAGGQDPGQGTGAGGNSIPSAGRTAPPERLGVEGEPVELDSNEGDGDGDGPPGDDQLSRPGGPASISGGGSSGDVGQSSPDPLRYETDERDVVQDYFQP